MAYLTRGARGTGTVLVSDAYRYHKNKVMRDSISWRCWRKSCKAMLSTNKFDSTVNRPAIVIRQVTRQLNYFRFTCSTAI